MSDSLFPKDSAFKQEVDRLTNLAAHDVTRVQISKEAAGGKTLTAQQVKRLRVILSELDDVTEGEHGTDALHSEAIDILR